MRRIFWSFRRNWFLMSPLHYLSGRSDFGFEFAEIFIFKKRLPAITDTGSHRLSVSVIQGVADSRYRWVGELTTPHITDTRSRWLPPSPIRRVGYWIFKKKLSVSMIRRVVDSPHQWYGKSPTPRIVESESHRLRVSPIRRVNDSAYRWVGDSMTPHISDTGVAIQKKISLASIFSTLNG